MLLRVVQIDLFLHMYNSYMIFKMAGISMKETRRLLFATCH